MDVWFCLMQEPSAERHCCVAADPDQTNCAPSGARPEICAFLLTWTYMEGGDPTGTSTGRQKTFKAGMGGRIRPNFRLLDNPDGIRLGYTP